MIRNSHWCFTLERTAVANGEKKGCSVREGIAGDYGMGMDVVGVEERNGNGMGCV